MAACPPGGCEVQKIAHAFIKVGDSCGGAPSVGFFRNNICLIKVGVSCGDVPSGGVRFTKYKNYMFCIKVGVTCGGAPPGGNCVCRNGTLKQTYLYIHDNRNIVM